MKDCIYAQHYRREVKGVTVETKSVCTLHGGHQGAHEVAEVARTENGAPVNPAMGTRIVPRHND